MDEKLVQEIASMIGEGLHACLRKQCQSTQADAAWKAIHYMPDDEWAGVCQTVAEEIVSTFIETKGD